MINNKYPIVFFGAGPYVIPVIETLNRKFNLVLVVTTEKNEANTVPQYCISNKVPYLSVSSLSSKIINNKLSIINCRVAVLASFGLIIPNDVLNMFDFGILNIHPSLLPKYRGPTPVQGAILAGEQQTGVSIIKLDSEVDHGPILVQQEEKIELTDTSDSLYKRLFKLGAELIVRDLPKYISGELKPREQDHSQATFTERLTRGAGFVDIENPPPVEQLNRMIRAYYPWPGAWFKCHPALDAGSRLNNKIIKLLPEQRIQVEGKNIMQLRDFENGYPEAKQILLQLSLS